MTPQNYDRILAQGIDRLKAEGRYREFADICRVRGRFPRALYRGHGAVREVTVWCSNDYLGMGQHPDVLAAMHAAVDDVGAGSGGTRNISGTNHPLVELEHELADLHGKEAALLFTSAYVANDSTLATLANLLPGAVIFSDEKNHASMIAGIRHGRGPKRIWRHNDIEDLEAHARDALVVQTLGEVPPQLAMTEERNARLLDQAIIPERIIIGLVCKRIYTRSYIKFNGPCTKAECPVVIQLNIGVCIFLELVIMRLVESCRTVCQVNEREIIPDIIIAR